MRTRSAALVILFLVALPVGGLAQVKPESVGIQATDSIKKFSGLNQFAVTLRYPTRFAERHYLYPDSFDATLGYVVRDGDQGAYIAIGPSYWFGPGNSASRRWILGFGLHVTLFTDSDFAGQDLGGKLQFTSNVGVGLYLNRQHSRSLYADVRHISNAGINSTNPGINLVALTYSHHFGSRRAKRAPAP